MEFNWKGLFELILVIAIIALMIYFTLDDDDRNDGFSSRHV